MSLRGKNAADLVCGGAEPAFGREAVERRLRRFEELFAKQTTTQAARRGGPITITLPDGKVVEGHAFETTPADVARGISKKLLERAVVARVIYAEGQGGRKLAGVEEEREEGAETELVVDMSQPLEGSCGLTLLTLDDPLARRTFFHSAAHLLGAALERRHGAYLCHGPPIESGFFYDAYTGSVRLTPADYETLESSAMELAQRNAPFQRLLLSKAEARELFADNPFKQLLIEAKVADDALTSAYRCGDFVDLCTGPHIPRTGLVGAFKVTKNSAAYWKGRQELDDLQRVYGVAFLSPRELADHLKTQAELEQRDHRAIGERQKLFLFDEISPGCCFYLPHGTRIFNRLVEFMRRQYQIGGFSEVNTPNIFKNALWKTSGHHFKYRENMFFLDVAGQEFGLKPMNCPAHCLMFDAHLRSYRDLPLRYADFGALHRNEVSGALTGLTRVRKLHQDDGHIFISEDQIEAEITSQIELLQYVYDVFGFESSFELSTRPEKFLGEPHTWERAEQALRSVLDKLGKKWKLNPGDGAYYGPKIDVKLLDCYKRSHQLATIQLDFVQPLRFNLQYRDVEEAEQSAPAEPETPVPPPPTSETPLDEEALYAQVGKLKPGFKRPIIVHRAILGSLERCIAILCEHFGGKWPFWLSPRQVTVLPLSDKLNDYAMRVSNRLRLEGFHCDSDLSNAKLNKKIRAAQLDQYNYILVVGAKEEQAGTVNVRERDAAEPRGEMKVGELVAFLHKQVPPASPFEMRTVAESFFGDEKRDELLRRFGVSEAQVQEWEARLEGCDYLGGEQPDEEDKKALAQLRYLDLQALGLTRLLKWRGAMAQSG